MGSIALTGTPGTGKSTVASRLTPHVRTLEVQEFARLVGAGCGRAGKTGRAEVVDLDLATRAWRAGRGSDVEMLVGHLSHLLPIRDTIVLRCHPRELAQRLARSRRMSLLERDENLLSEATDLILIEAVERRRRIWEVDTTGRTVESVAGEVRRIVHHRTRPSYGRVDWLGDPWVTAHLLDWSR